MNSLDPFPFMLAHADFFEKLDYYTPRTEFKSLVQEIVPSDWRIVRRGVYFHCMHEERETPPQGWKIHLSGIPGEAKSILDVSVPVFVHNKISFKFVVDERMLQLVNGKNWPRGSSGKFHYRVSA